MTTVKEILSENRDSVISSIKYAFKIWKTEDVKVKMIEFLAYAEGNFSFENYTATKAKKTYLKNLVSRMKMIQEKAANLKRYGTENPKLADIMAFGAELHEQRNEVWHPIYKSWVKNENAFSSMAKNPTFA